MRKIHVLTCKEEIDSSRIMHCTAVIIDVLLATSTIAATLYHGAKEVIPVMDEEEAMQLVCTLSKGSYILSGEKDGYPPEGFLRPDPVSLVQTDIKGKTLIFATTNGTVAIKKATAAKAVYISSLLNGPAVAQQITNNSDGTSVVIVCGGSRGRFALEDMIGAGYLVSELLEVDHEDWKLSDTALAAVQLYQHCSYSIEQALQQSETGEFLSKLKYHEAIRYVARLGVLPVAPRLQDSRLII